MHGYESSHLCRCKACGLVFAQAIPTLEELEAYYDGYGRDDYLSPLTVKRYHELLDQFESYRSTGRILDVGCGIGYFLEVAKERGWEVFGTEFTDRAVEICEEKGIEMHKGVLDPADYQPESFDIITSFEVLEHINTPVVELTKFYHLLRKGGLVYLTTPNFNSLIRRILGPKYDVICYPEHLTYFTPSTIDFAFRKSGFTKSRLQTTGFSVSRLRAKKGEEMQEYISPDSDDEKLRRSLEGSRWLRVVKELVNSLLTLFGSGDTLKCWYVKGG